MWNKIQQNPMDPSYVHTLREIKQQPSCWKKVAKLVLENTELKTFFTNAIKDIDRPIIVSGAGSSEFAGQSVLDTLSKLTNRRVLNAPTTDIVTNPKKYTIPKEPALMISFARSGNSPESVASVDLIKQVSPTTRHLIITCNENGSLGTMKADNIFNLILPKETNDESLVMTSSFSSMILAAVLCGYFSNKEYAYDCVEKICQSTEEIFKTKGDLINNIVKNNDIERFQYLGSSDAYGLLTEGHLKMLEMTDGLNPTRIDSFLGLRHGPQVFVNKNTVVTGVLSNDPYVYQYEIDMLKELQAKKQGYAYVIVGNLPSDVKLPNAVVIPSGTTDEFFRLLPSVVVVQLLGMLKSLYLGLSPDAPSASGTINRVVQGVNIYPLNKS